MGALAILCCPRHRMPTGTAGSHLLSVFEPRPLSLAASRADALRIAARERGMTLGGQPLKCNLARGAGVRPQTAECQDSQPCAAFANLYLWGMHLTPVATRTSGVFSRKKRLPMSSRGTRRSSRARSAAPKGAEGSLRECSRAAGPRTPLPHRHRTSEKRDPSTSRTLRSG
jgi:hypothetical protein